MVLQDHKTSTQVAGGKSTLNANARLPADLIAHLAKELPKEQVKIKNLHGEAKSLCKMKKNSSSTISLLP